MGAGVMKDVITWALCVVVGTFGMFVVVPYEPVVGSIIVYFAGMIFGKVVLK
jgi:hypothetical protein